MNKVLKNRWYFSIGLNILFDLIFVSLIFLFRNNNLIFLSSFCVLVLHAIYLLIISILYFIRFKSLKGVAFLVQSVLLGLWLVLVLRWLLLVLSFDAGAVYTDEGFVKSEIQQCEYSNSISDSTFFILMTGVKDSTLNTATINARQKYFKDSLNIIEPYKIVRRGCRTYEDSVIVFRLQFKSKTYYDAEIKKQDHKKYVIVNFRYSHFL